MLKAMCNSAAVLVVTTFDKSAQIINHAGNTLVNVTSATDDATGIVSDYAEDQRLLNRQERKLRLASYKTQLVSKAKESNVELDLTGF